MKTRAALRVGAALCAHVHAAHFHALHPDHDRDKEQRGRHRVPTNAGTDALAASVAGGLALGSLSPVPGKQPRAHERDACVVPGCVVPGCAVPDLVRAAAHDEPRAAETGGKSQDARAQISVDTEARAGAPISEALRGRNGGKYRDSKREGGGGGGQDSVVPTVDSGGECEVSGLECGSWDGLCVDAAVRTGLFKRHIRMHACIQEHLYTCMRVYIHVCVFT